MSELEALAQRVQARFDEVDRANRRTEELVKNIAEPEQRPGPEVIYWRKENGVTYYEDERGGPVFAEYAKWAENLGRAVLTPAPEPKEREGPGSWPSPVVIRLMPPAPVYDHRSMRESGRPKPHALDPVKLNRTLCGKNPDWWRLQVTPAAVFDFVDFTIYGCATCAKKALALTIQPKPETSESPGGR